ncbi:hypothetical protein MKI84_03525 [Ancylobacter sp. A5.8]|uniref:hypothetical protein n=1 Tax=Ancylobacter gelatini TaxID=2919920 RepID=UPI001F4DB793|nr:hypothetical protein [Ancylobacter gelatini]MCJ8141978.1 hypothetical protein [Ancylobacter gelatini]
MNRTTTLVIAAIVLGLALYAAIDYSGRTTTQPTESPTPPVGEPVTPPAPATPAPAAPAP